MVSTVADRPQLGGLLETERLARLQSLAPSFSATLSRE
jgi:hypothetical protein